MKIWYTKIKDLFGAYKTVIGIAFRADKLLFTIYTMLTMLIKFVPLITLLLWQDVVNLLAIGEDSVKLMIKIAFYLLFTALLMVFKEIALFISVMLSKKQERAIDVEILNKHARVGAEFFDNPENEDMVYSVQKESYYIRTGATRLTTLMSSIVAIGASVVTFASTQPIACLIFIVTCIPGCILEFKCEDSIDVFEFQRIEEFRRKDYYKKILTEREYAKELRVYGLADYFKDKYNKLQKYLNKKLAKLYASNMRLLILSSVLTYGSVVVFTLIFTKQAIDGVILVGTLSLYIGLMVTIKEQFVDTMVHIFFDFEDWIPHINRYSAFVESANDIADFGKEEVPKLPSITFSHVYFTYPGAEEPTIKDMSFLLEGGKTMALVGVNGAGKTTIIKLLLRLYEPQAGSILLDGRDIKEYSLASLRRTFSVCFQDVTKYALTLRECITVGNIHDKIDDKAVYEALKMSDIEEIAASFENGLDTQMTRQFSKEGHELSEGQWQKLAIARTFYRDSDIVILDEPSSALDPIAEDSIFRSFRDLCRKRSGILISHRLSGIMNVDKIIVIENGELIEEGSHTELMKKNGKYAYMYRLQADKYVSEKRGNADE